MSYYRLNTPVRAGKKTKWYRLLEAIAKTRLPFIHKVVWLSLADVEFSNENPIVYDKRCRQKTRWSYRHWRGIYPALFSKFRRTGLVIYERDLGWAITPLGRRVYEDLKVLVDREVIE